MTIKEMSNQLKELYSEKNNHNRTFNVIQEIIRSMKGNGNIKHYADFNEIYELKVSSPISWDMKKMHTQ